MDLARRISRIVVGRGFSWLLLLVAVHLIGCSQMPDFLNTAQQEATLFAEDEKRREEFLTERTPESIQWLLSNRVKNGMSKGDIDRILGEQGDRVFNDSKILSEGGLYRADDIVHRWGPDKQGNVYMLVFRDNHLINYENFKPKNELAGANKFL